MSDEWRLVMRFRKRGRKKRAVINVSAEPVEDSLPEFVTHANATQQQQVEAKGKNKGINPMRFVRQMVKNPDFSYQALMIFMTLTSGDNMRMDQRIETVSTSVEKMKSATEVIGTTMKSLRAAAEAPRHIRKLFN
jgi:hypothetical protein